MEGEFISTVTNLEAKPIVEVSDANSRNNSCQRTDVRRDDNTTSFQKFKGVVKHRNGNWGAQIYANNKRTWLGTFKTQMEAARAYDSATIRLRGGDSQCNFPCTNHTIQNPKFQDLHAIEAVLNMIEVGSYQAKFIEFSTSRSLMIRNEFSGRANKQGILCQPLFNKKLTPSDVGKLNRLIIPKVCATTYFHPDPIVSMEGDEDLGEVEGIELTFFDRQLKSWNFRFCYWKTSRCFVFRNGWTQFVKEKGLKANDIVIFYRWEYTKEFKEEQPFFMIDIQYVGGQKSGGVDGEEVDLQLSLRGNFKGGSNREDKREEGKKKVVELFGVQIN